MIETLLQFVLSSLLSGFKFIFEQPKLKLECGSNLFPNEDEVGNFLGFWVRVINPTKDTIYFGRLEAKDSKGEVFFPMSLSNIEKEILPRRNIMLIIPCGHITSTMPKEISIVDATQKYHKLKGRKLFKAVTELKVEFERLKSLGLEVHPRRN